MTREMLDEYLDGALGAAASAALETQLTTDANAAELLARMKRERALRSAAIASFAPSKDETDAATARVLALLQDEAVRPVGRIGFWMKRSLGVAAVLAIVAGGFVAGRATAPVTIVEKETRVVDPGKTLYTVVYPSTSGEQQTKEFATALESQAFVAQLQLESRHALGSAVASVDDHGTW